MKNLFLLLLAVSNVVLAGCEKNEAAMPDEPGDPGNTTGLEKGYAKGRVVDATGKPIAGAQVFVDNTIYYNSGISTTTDANGYYRVQVPMGSWRVYATIDRQYNGVNYPKLEMHPDNSNSFAGGDGAIRNFVWKLQGEKPAPLAGYYGGIVYLGADPNSNMYDIENIEFTFTPVGKLIDGSTGQAFTARSGAPRTDNFSKIVDVPMGRYTVTAKHVPSNQPIKLLVEEASTNFSELVTLDFFPELNYCRRCVRLIYKEN